MAGISRAVSIKCWFNRIRTGIAVCSYFETTLQCVLFTAADPKGTIRIGQLKLTGIVRSANGNKRLLREASGRVSTDIRIGIHGGRVAEV